MEKERTMESDENFKSSDEPRPTRKAYASPSVRAYGNIHDITLSINSPNGGTDNGINHPRKTAG